MCDPGQDMISDGDGGCKPNCKAIPGCAACQPGDAAQCRACDAEAGYKAQPTDGDCICDAAAGFFSNGFGGCAQQDCDALPGCTDQTCTAAGAARCSACDAAAGFKAAPVDGRCECDAAGGYAADGAGGCTKQQADCTATISGCKTCVATDRTKCAACNTTANFKPAPASGKCACATGYELKSGQASPLEAGSAAAEGPGSAVPGGPAAGGASASLAAAWVPAGLLRLCRRPPAPPNIPDPRWPPRACSASSCRRPASSATPTVQTATPQLACAASARLATVPTAPTRQWCASHSCAGRPCDSVLRWGQHALALQASRPLHPLPRACRSPATEAPTRCQPPPTAACRSACAARWPAAPSASPTPARARSALLGSSCRATRCARGVTGGGL